MEYSFDTWTSLFLLASAQGGFLAIILIASQKQPKLILGTITLLFSITLIEYVFFWTGFRYTFPHLNRISDPFFFLFGPLFYFYIKSQKGNFDFILLRNWIHFIPFFLLVGISVPYYLLGTETKIELSIQGIQRAGIVKYFFISKPWLQLFSMIFYLGLSWRIKKNNSIQNSKRLRILLYLFWGFVLAYGAYYLMIYTIGYLKDYDYAISIAMTIFIYGVSYLGFKNELDLEKDTSVKKYKSSSLTEEEIKLISIEVYKKMESDKIYLQRSLSLETLAVTVNTTKHNLSQVLNYEIGKKFSDFINEYRIKEAEKLIMGKSDELSMSGIAYEAGFNNKTSFNTAFKKFTGLTPTQYLKEKAEESVKSD